MLAFYNDYYMVMISATTKTKHVHTDRILILILMLMLIIFYRKGVEIAEPVWLSVHLPHWESRTPFRFCFSYCNCFFWPRFVFSSYKTETKISRWLLARLLRVLATRLHMLPKATSITSTFHLKIGELAVTKLLQGWCDENIFCFRVCLLMNVGCGTRPAGP